MMRKWKPSQRSGNILTGILIGGFTLWILGNATGIYNPITLLTKLFGAGLGLMFLLVCAFPIYIVGLVAIQFLRFTWRWLTVPQKQREEEDANERRRTEWTERMRKQGLLR